MHAYIPTQSPEDWKSRLADPDKHWRMGYSARALAHCWEEAQGFPAEVLHLFQSASLAALHTTQPLLMLPEYKVPLPGRGFDSQNDLFVLAKAGDGALVSLMVEGKVNESFGQPIGVWKGSADGTVNKNKRLAGLMECVGLAQLPDTIYYQLLHRAASAVIAARLFNAVYAIMIVHSFSPIHAHWDAFADFVLLYGQTEERGKLMEVAQIGAVRLLLGWATGTAAYLTR
jgi:hypothetical protein